MEALRLRVQDLDVQRLQITVRDGKGGKDRRTMLPARVAQSTRSGVVTPLRRTARLMAHR